MTFLKYTLSILLVFFTFSISLAQEAGFREVQLTTDASDNMFASYNKLGTKIIFESNRNGNWQIYLMETDSLKQERITTNDFNDRRPTWHPSKNIVLFESDRSGTNEIYQLDLNTYVSSRIPIKSKGEKKYAQFAPNGEDIVFNLIRSESNADIFKVHESGKRLKKIVDNTNSNLYPHYSRKGDEVIYHSDKNPQGDANIIYTYNIITKDRSRLTYFKNESFQPIWSNKRNQIAYVASIDGNKPEIYKMRIDGSNKARITINEVDDFYPSWSPDDTNLLITGFRDGHFQIIKVLLKERIKQKEGVQNTVRD